MGKLYNVSENDYFNLDEIYINAEEEKRELHDFTIGVCKEKMYTGICNVCRGFGLDNPKVVCAGEQIKNEETIYE